MPFQMEVVFARHVVFLAGRFSVGSGINRIDCILAGSIVLTDRREYDYVAVLRSHGYISQRQVIKPPPPVCFAAVEPDMTWRGDPAADQSHANQEPPAGPFRRDLNPDYLSR